jgi:PAS domain S-box-containing protein
MVGQADMSASGHKLRQGCGKISAAADRPDSLQDELQKLRKEKDYFASVIKNFRNGMLTTDNDLNIVFCNLTVERLLGFTTEELQSMKLSDLIKTQETTVKNILAQGGLCVDPRTGELGEFSFITKNGNTFPVEACFSVITDADGSVCGMSCTFRDVTRKKQMEQALARMDRLASLGELASGMAHEIKNPLACIAGVMQNLPCPGSNDSCAVMVPEILAQVKRIDTIINALLHFAKPGSSEMQPLRIAGIVKSTLELVERHLRENEIELQFVYGDCDPWIRGDEYLLQQVLLNVVMNACEALAEVEHKRILNVTVTCQEHHEHSAAENQAGIFAYVDIEIADNGKGIDNSSLESVFNPFFTTKNSGTGLGLATSHRIMDEHDGSISVTSDPGNGATFKLSLPIYNPG